MNDLWSDVDQHLAGVGAPDGMPCELTALVDEFLGHTPPCASLPVLDYEFAAAPPPAPTGLLATWGPVFPRPPPPGSRNQRPLPGWTPPSMTAFPRAGCRRAAFLAAVRREAKVAPGEKPTIKVNRLAKARPELATLLAWFKWLNRTHVNQGYSRNRDPNRRGKRAGHGRRR
jgi:hypothetical protein